MSDSKPVTSVAVFFDGIKKGERLKRRQSETLVILDGHRLLSEEELAAWAKHSPAIVAASGYRKTEEMCVRVAWGEYRGDLFIQSLLSKQVQLV